MKDVARRANVSLGTVSRIVNSNATVAPELRRHVEAVIRELGYRPNVSARTMRTRRTHAIGIIVTDLRQPVAATLVAQASEIARRHGFAPIVGDFQNDAAAEERRGRGLDRAARRGRGAAGWSGQCRIVSGARLL